MCEKSVFDGYRAAVNRPMRRLAGVYGRPRARWLDLGLIGTVVAQFVSLVPPVVLGAAIDALFTDDAPYRLPLVPGGWLPASRTGQFELSVGLSPTTRSSSTIPTGGSSTAASTSPTEGPVRLAWSVRAGDADVVPEGVEGYADD